MNEKYYFANAANGGKRNIMKKRVMKKGALAGSMLLAASLLSGCAPKEVPAVYGPPEYFDPSETPLYTEDNLPAPVYGPPEDFELDFDPSLNDVTGVYGPPPFPYDSVEIKPAEETEETPAPEETEAQP